MKSYLRASHELIRVFQAEVGEDIPEPTATLVDLRLGATVVRFCCVRLHGGQCLQSKKGPRTPSATRATTRHKHGVSEAFLIIRKKDWACISLEDLKAGEGSM